MVVEIKYQNVYFWELVRNVWFQLFAIVINCLKLLFSVINNKLLLFNFKYGIILLLIV